MKGIAPPVFKVNSMDYVGSPATFTVGVEGNALAVTHNMIMSEDTNVAATVAVKFSKGRIEVKIKGDDPKDDIGAIYTQVANGSYTCGQTGNADYTPGMELIGKALFQNEIYPDIIGATLKAVQMLKPEEARALTNVQQHLLRDSSRLLSQMKSAEAER